MPRHYEVKINGSKAEAFQESNFKLFWCYIVMNYNDDGDLVTIVEK